MPTYQYQCKDCTHDFEVVQKFTDSALTTCPECSGTLRKVFSPVGVVFKGSGFYATDNRTKGATSAAIPAGESKAPESKPAETKSETKSEPAAAAS